MAAKFGPFTRRQVGEAFRAFDLDNNDFVGAAELRKVYQSLGENATDEEIDEMIAMVDTDGDGQISLPEFAKMVFRYAAEAPEGADSDADDATDQPPAEDAPLAAAAAGVVAATPRAAPEPLSYRDRRGSLREAAGALNLGTRQLEQFMGKFKEVAAKHITLDYPRFCEAMGLQQGPLVQRLFSVFDSNGSGSIDLREFLVGLASLVDATKDDRIKFAFDVFDIDHNGFISRDELLLMLKANHMALSDAQVAKKAAAIMRQADRDGDNRITFDEFRSACHRFPNLVFPVFDDADAARASSAPRAAGDRSDDE